MCILVYLTVFCHHSKQKLCLLQSQEISVELVGNSVLMPLFPDDVIEVSDIPMNAISISVVNIPHSAWQLKVVEGHESCIIPHHSSTAQGTNETMRQQKQNSWTTIQLKERHRHTSTQLQTNWLPLIQLQCMPLYHKKCIILRIKLPDVAELLAISLSATIRINIMAMTIACAATLTKQADFTIQVIQCFSTLRSEAKLLI